MYYIYDNLLKKKNVSNYKVSKETGITQTTLSAWKNGKITPKTDTLQKIADYFGVSLDYLTGHSKSNSFENDNKEIKSTRIPVLGKVSAGIPIEAIENYEGDEWEEIPQEMASKWDYFALKIKGKSMEPKFSENDVVIVRKQPTLESGEIGVVVVNGCDATVKKVYKQENGISLIALNQDVFAPKFYDNKEIEELPVKILGKVVELRAKF